MDNKKLKKRDGKRFAILQKYERTYMKKQLKKLIKVFEKDVKIAKNEKRTPFILLWETKHLEGTNHPTKPIIHCLKGALKLLLYVENQLKKKRRKK